MAPEHRITGATRLAAVIGSPVRHSRSPVLANAAFEASGADWVMVALDVPAGGGAEAVEAARRLGIGGMMVTMPHKAAVIPALDGLTPAAEALGAVNSIAREGDLLIGDNTDGPGLVASLARSGVAVEGLPCIVIGAGGAARSIAWALGASGASDVGILNRTYERAVEAAALAGTVGRVAEPADVAGADLVVNATSVGMGSAPDDPTALPFDPVHLRAGQVVVDAVYQPLETALLRAATRAGARPVDGLGMLVGQAAITIERWIGTAPDVGAMEAAARSMSAGQ